jgi:hypothetical protein
MHFCNKQIDESAVVRVTLVKVLVSVIHYQYEEGASNIIEDIQDAAKYPTYFQQGIVNEGDAVDGWYFLLLAHKHIRDIHSLIISFSNPFSSSSVN